MQFDQNKRARVFLLSVCLLQFDSLIPKIIAEWYHNYKAGKPKATPTTPKPPPTTPS